MGRPRRNQHSTRVYPEYSHEPTSSLDRLNPSHDDHDNPREDDDEDSSSVLSTFPPHHQSPLLGSPTGGFFRRSEPSNSSSYRTMRGRTRGLKAKVTCRWVRMPALILLCLGAIIAFVFVPWHQSRSGLDLNQLRVRENHLDGFAIHNISAPDGSIYGSFVGLGASVQSLFVKDRHGSFRDIVLGYDNTSEYLHHPVNPRFGSVVGRYANRIKNSSFVIPGHPDQIFRTTPNEHGGLNTLHGGDPGWDRRPFQVEAKNLSYISFSLVDHDGEQGFPSEVVSKIEYQLLSGGKWKTKMTAQANGLTPIMLSSHVYWNLDAYAADESASKHILQLNAPQYIATDPILIPTGKLESVKNTPLDFIQPAEIGSRFKETAGLCGQDCIGYDNALVYDVNRPIDVPVMAMWSQQSGIKMSVITDQIGVQVYTCNAIVPKKKNIPPVPRKKSQNGPDAVYENHSCVAIEQQGLIDAINHPEWKINSIYGPDRPYEWNTIYEFSTI
ncbi:hypothetical protein PGTUg99_028505 [Puccinia graminis f. sp. tritici]|uniref:Aldose 1-epimerase n=1 Tax=Puccinia graminis f. sp. tritici TaxID=56615 RepID=A0A5B0R7W9_PUCGR|nr:hypothetical protein PGTUg99_028505 [Puccinia graminis f. sp. tritici]